MAKESTAQESKGQDETPSRVRSSEELDGNTFEDTVQRQENVGEVSNEKAKEINGYKGHRNIASKVKEDQESKGRSRDDETSTGAKFF